MKNKSAEKVIEINVCDPSKVDPTAREKLRSAVENMRSVRQTIVEVKELLVSMVQNHDPNSGDILSFEQIVATTTDPQLVRIAAELALLTRGEARRSLDLVNSISSGAFAVMNQISSDAADSYAPILKNAVRDGQLDAQKDCPCDDCKKDRQQTIERCDA